MDAWREFNIALLQLSSSFVLNTTTVEFLISDRSLNDLCFIYLFMDLLCVKSIAFQGEKLTCFLLLWFV